MRRCLLPSIRRQQVKGSCEEAEFTASRRNFVQNYFQVPHRSTVYRLGKQLDVNSGVGEETTPARAEATRSNWNAVSFAAMNCKMLSLLVVHLTVNRDASQFKVSNALDGRVEVKFIVDDGRPGLLVRSQWPISCYSCFLYFIK